MIQGYAKFDNNVKAEDEKREKDWAVCRPVYWSLARRVSDWGAKDCGTIWATVGEWFLGAWLLIYHGMSRQRYNNDTRLERQCIKRQDAVP